MVFLCSCGGLIWENRVHVCGQIRCSCGAIKFNGRGHCCGYTPDYSVPPTDWELYSGYRSSDEWIGSITWGKRSPSLFNTKNQEKCILNTASSMEDIKNHKQTDSFQDYCKTFDSLLTKVILSEIYAISLFVEGLKPDIMNWVKFLNPKTLVEAYEKAKNQANLLAIIESFSESKKNRDQILNSSEIQFDEVKNRAEIQEVCDNNVQEMFVDEVIDTDVISENILDGYVRMLEIQEPMDEFGKGISVVYQELNTQESQKPSETDGSKNSVMIENFAVEGDIMKSIEGDVTVELLSPLVHQVENCFVPNSTRPDDQMRGLINEEFGYLAYILDPTDTKMCRMMLTSEKEISKGWLIKWKWKPKMFYGLAGSLSPTYQRIPLEYCHDRNFDALCKGSMRELSSAISLQVFSLLNIVELLKRSVQNKDVTMWVWDPGSIFQLMRTPFISGLLRTKVFEGECIADGTMYIVEGTIEPEWVRLMVRLIVDSDLRKDELSATMSAMFGLTLWLQLRDKMRRVLVLTATVVERYRLKIQGVAQLTTTDAERQRLEILICCNC